MRRRYVGLDGIKGLAIIAILLYHMQEQMLPGGFYGVDVFFTVSGFLIGVSLLRSLMNSGSLRLERYIPKRAVRLYPALFLLIPVIVSVGWLYDRDLLVSIRDQIITVLLGCYNWYAIASGQSYFDQMSPQTFRHLWFIGVLMQCYVVAPCIVWLMWKIRRSHLSALIPLALAAGSGYAMWMLYIPGGDPTRVYFGTDTHAVGLMLGLALAWWVTSSERGRSQSQRIARRVASVNRSGVADATPSMSALNGAHRQPNVVSEPLHILIWRAVAPLFAFMSLIALVAMTIIGKQNDFAFHGGIVISSVLALLLVAGTICQDSWMQDLMVFRPLAGLGKYSYGIYLWHWPLCLASKSFAPKLFPVPGPWPLIMAAVLTAVAVTLSWILVEKPAASNSAVFVILPLHKPSRAHIVRAIVVDALLAASLFGAVQGVANAPAKTAMQIQLEEQARQLEAMQRKEHALIRREVPKPPRPRFAMPAGDEMTAIGDSVMLASSQGLSSVFPGIQTDAEVSRSIMVASDMIQNDLSAGTLRQWVLVGLATNSEITDGQLDQIHDMIGPDHVLVLINAHGDRTWIPSTNQVLADYAAAHPDNVVLVDWNAAATANPQILGSDGIHPKLDSDLYAQTVKSTIAAWIKGNH
ncbi:acyltransferase family protein [Bifidobacterium cebidarum]|uniref:acyltransferase family protein n=1 Tax=Bifidobacterium cebidarum TaxID=2650773 RepID=UPI001265AB33|nr:acyltransferase family protein [Bifidobacterium cebidarum]